MAHEAVIQALRRVEQLKSKLQNVGNLLVDGTILDTQQKLVELYQQVLLVDLEYALDQKVEQDLWNYGHKNIITALQGYASNPKHPKCKDAQHWLTWFLDGASGYYLTLLGDVCSQFKLDLPFRRDDSTFGLSWPDMKYHPAEPQKSSCLYFSQHCLVHLGDISRYRGSLKQAETYYKHAVTMSPTCGQPYNQLTLLAAKNDHLSAIFYGVRSITVQHPFPVAAINLDKTLSKCADAEIRLDGKSCLSGPELVAVFLKFHGLLRCRGNIADAKPLIEIMGKTLTTLVALNNFSEWKLVQMLIINIFMHQDAKGEQKQVALDLIGALLSACLLPVYTMTKDKDLLDYPPIPSLKLTFEWLTINPSLLEMPGLVEKKQILPGLRNMLDRLRKLLSSSEMVDATMDYSGFALPEDRDIQGFLPLNAFLSKLKFSRVQNNALNIPLVRCASLLKVGESLTEVFPDANSGHKTPAVHEQFASPDFIRSLQVLNVDQETNPDSFMMRNGSSATSPVNSDSSTWGTGKSTPDSSVSRGSNNGPENNPVVSVEEDLWRPKVFEKENAAEPPQIGRINQNVAMQAILRGRQPTVDPPPLSNQTNGWEPTNSLKPSQPPESSLFGKSISDSSCAYQKEVREFKLWEAPLWESKPADAVQTQQGAETCKENVGSSLFSYSPLFCLKTGNPDATKDKTWNTAAPPKERSYWRTSSALNNLLEQQRQQREGGT